MKNVKYFYKKSLYKFSKINTILALTYFKCYLFYENICTQKILKDKIIQICDEKIKIAKKGENVGISFYAFFKNKNDNPDLLMEAALGGLKNMN